MPRRRSRILRNIEYIILDTVDFVTPFAAAISSLGGCNVESVRTGEAFVSLPMHYYRCMEYTSGINGRLV